MERFTRSQLRQTLFQLNFLVVPINTFSRFLTLLAEPVETVKPADEDGDEARSALFHMDKPVTTSDIFFRFKNWFVEISAIDSSAFWVLIQLIVVTWLEKVTITNK
jgi:hypothetical protein